MFLKWRVSSSLGGFISCNLNMPIRKAPRIMNEAGPSAILLTSESEAMIGILTDLLLHESVSEVWRLSASWFTRY